MSGIHGGLGVSDVVPGGIFPLEPWKLQLPALVAGGPPEEVKQPRLASFSRSGVFTVVSDGGGRGVEFRANAYTDLAQGGSQHARVELKEEAAWSPIDGRHVMSIRQAVTQLPSGRPAVVVGQIHGVPNDIYLALIRLDGRKLWVKLVDDEVVVLDSDYELGRVFRLGLVVERGRCEVIHDGEIKTDFKLPFLGPCYFKAGMYLQTNRNAYRERPGSMGAATIYDLRVGHTPA